MKEDNNKKSGTFLDEIRTDLRCMRNELGLSQSEIAKQCHALQTSISAFETGKCSLEEPALNAVIDLVIAWRKLGRPNKTSAILGTITEPAPARVSDPHATYPADLIHLSSPGDPVTLSKSSILHSIHVAHREGSVDIEAKLHDLVDSIERLELEWQEIHEAYASLRAQLSAVLTKRNHPA